MTGPDSQARTADEGERTLFRRRLALGAAWLRLFFLTRAATRPVAPVSGPDGTPLVDHDQRPTTYFSVFGTLRFRRHAFTAPGQPVVCPLDAALSLPARCSSDLLRDGMAYSSTAAAYRETQTLLERILGLTVRVQASATPVADDARDGAAFVARPPAAPPPTSTGTMLVAQADGTGGPLVPPPRPRPARRGQGPPESGKHDASVTALDTVAPDWRTPPEIVAARLHEAARPDPPARPVPLGKELRATLDGKAAALTRLAQRAAQQDGAALQQRVALTDGAAARQEPMRAHRPGSTLVRAIIHATESLWDAANAVLGERHPERTAWVRRHLTQVLTGQVAAGITALDAAAAAPACTGTHRQALGRTVGDYRRHQPWMHYDMYLAPGWPSGAGVVEGACRHGVKDRMEQSGRRWTEAGAQHRAGTRLALRAVRLNGAWDTYWPWHRQQQHERRYEATRPAPAPSETQALAVAA